MFCDPGKPRDVSTVGATGGRQRDSSGGPHRTDLVVRITIVRTGSHNDIYHRIRKWCLEQQDLRLPGLEIDIEGFADLSDAEVAFEHPDRVVVVTIGIGANRLRKFIQRAADRSVELLVVSRDRHLKSRATPFAPGQINVTASDPEPLLRKAVLRLYVGQIVRFRELPAERLPEYLALRYRVWDEVWKKLEDAPEESENDEGWEVNYSDLNALPIGAFSREDDRLVGCARLVRPRGRETHFANPIRELVKSSPRLSALVGYGGYDYPYDMFEPFPAFQDYYQNLVRQRVKPGEVSRVMLEHAWRGKKVGEALVDQLVLFAQARGYKRLFLACMSKHEPLYGQSGFRRIPDLESEKFGRMNVSAIAMERSLDG